jgi:predicted transcriptional regulator
MGQEDVRNVLKETGRGMSLEELARMTGLAKTTVLRNVNTLWRRHEVSRMYRFDEVTNVRYVYYFYGSRMPNDNAMGCAWQGKDHLLKVLSAHR